MSIHKLPEDVVNRIAAGEVVQRPSAALKELLENAIDAGCTRVQVLAAEGGLEVLQVSDDGSGIHRTDLPLLCERYATSKLTSFEDLRHVTSFGFRGEALASISYVSRVTVTTRRRPASRTLVDDGGEPAVLSVSTASSSTDNETQVAWRAQYLNGSLVSDPQPCAGNYGTSIRAEKLFYNALVRRNSLRASEEWGRVVDVVSRYALAYPEIGFTCQKASSGGGGGGASLSGTGSGVEGRGGGGLSFPPLSTTRQNIRLSHGASVTSHLRLVYAYDAGSSTTTADGADEEDGRVKDDEKCDGSASAFSQTKSQGSGVAQETRVFSQMRRRASCVRACVGSAGEGLFTLVGYTSDPTLALRKHYLCLFINQRLVESVAIRKAVEGVYSGVLTSGHRPFTVLLLTVPTDRLDVNVHPTKKEVVLLDEEVLVAKVAEVCRGAVLEAAAARQMDMLKMRHTATLALRQLPTTDGTGGHHGDTPTDEGIGSSSQQVLEKLRDQHRRGTLMAPSLTSSPSSTAAAKNTGMSSRAVVVAPCTVVRVEQQRGALDRYFSQRLSTDGGTTLSTLTEASSLLSSSSSRVFSSQEDVSPVQTIAADAEKSRADDAIQSRSAASGEMVHSGGVEDKQDRGKNREGGSSGTHFPAPLAASTAPSWDDVMASLHRAGPSTAAAPSLSPSPPTPDGPSTKQGLEGCAPESGEVNQSLPNAPADPSVEEKEEMPQWAAGRGAMPLPSRRYGNSDDEEEENESEGEGEVEDRMREFKRHRSDVHDRVVATEWEGGQGPPVKMKLEPYCGSSIALSPSAQNSTTTSVKEERLGLGAASTAAASDSRTSASSAAHKDTKDDADDVVLARLDAVARAADLMRDEANRKSGEDATKQIHFIASSSEDGEDDDAMRRDQVHIHANREDGAASLVEVTELAAPAVLSSVSMMVERILDASGPSAASLTAQLSYVGAVDDGAFLAQVGTTLVWCDTMALVRHAVFQRIFLRWGQPSLPAPPVLRFETPMPLSALLAAALVFDGPQLQPPTETLQALLVMEQGDEKKDMMRGTSGEYLMKHAPDQDKGFARGTETRRVAADALQSLGGLSARAWQERLFEQRCEGIKEEENKVDGRVITTEADHNTLPEPKPATRRYIHRLVRRLCRWRLLLKDYFFLDISADGLLVSIPYGLNRHWPPCLRALPLTMWLLAEAVPYPTSPVLPPVPDPTAAVKGEVGLYTSSSTTTSSAAEAEAGGVEVEVACFTAVARHLADVLYGRQAPPVPPCASAKRLPCSSPQEGRGSTQQRGSKGQRMPGTGMESECPEREMTGVAMTEETWREELVQHGLFPCLKNGQLFRLPDHCIRDGTIQSMVSVESLYKVFERC